jgi:tetraacyldisaccharide 4'-kinase
MRLSAWLHQQLPRVWTSKGLLAWLLLPVSWLHAALLRARRLAWHWGWRQAHRLPVPVIVVGNVVAGGAGKTPLTMALVQHLQQRGWHVGVISRGHGRKTRDTRAVMPDSLPNEVGDEPLLIRQKTGVPVWVAAMRAEAGRGLLQAHPDVNVLVCDDGLQHLALARDLEICVMDERGVGNGWLLPAGPLREPWPRSVDLLLHTGTNGLPGGFQAQRQLAPMAHDGQGRSLALSSLIGQPVDAVAGLARPEAFFAMLRATGLQLQIATALPDHFDYAHGAPAATDRPLLCTEKDAAKLWQHQPQALAVPLVLTPEAAFWKALDQRLAEKPFR